MALVKYIGPAASVNVGGVVCAKGNSIEVSAETATSLLGQAATWEAGNEETKELVPFTPASVLSLTGYQGAWDTRASYVSGEFVSEGSGLYLSLVANTGLKPSTHAGTWLACGGGGSGGLTLAEVEAIAVKLTGNQTIAGVKTFSSAPIVPTPTTGTQAVPKAYADALILPSVTGEFNAKISTGTTLALSSSVEKWLVGKLEENTVIKLTAFPGPSKAKFQMQQDGSGNRTLTIEDPAGHKYKPFIPTAPFASFDVYIECPDGANLYISVQGNPQATGYGYVPADVTAIKEQTTLQELAALAVPIGTSFTEAWLVTWRLFFTSNNVTMGLKFGLTAPAGMTGYWGASGNAAVKGPTPLEAGKTPPLMATIAETPAYASGIGTTGIVLQGTFFGGGTEGNLVLKYAQNASNAETLQVRKGSSVEYVQVSA